MGIEKRPSIRTIGIFTCKHSRWYTRRKIFIFSSLKKKKKTKPIWAKAGYPPLVHPCTKFELDNSKFAEVGQFGRNIFKIQISKNLNAPIDFS